MTFQQWGRVTGKDKRAATPNQQATFLGRVADYSILSPYGLYCDLPAETLLAGIKYDAAMGCAQKRPGDVAQGEPTFYHPETDTRVIARNDGTLDILTGSGSGVVNIIASATVNVQCADAAVSASGSVQVTAATATVDAETTINGATTINGDTTINGNLEVDGDFENSGAASLGGPGGKPIARKDDPTDGSKITMGSGQHTAT